MTNALPKPIADYLSANADLDLDGMLKPFLPDAVIVDLNKRLAGQAAIRRLFEEEVIPVKAVFTADTVRNEGDGVVIEGPAHGDFPGSPIRFTYRFTLLGDAIQTLEISL